MKLSIYRQILKKRIDKIGKNYESLVEILNNFDKILKSCEKECTEIAKNRNKDYKQARVAIVGSLFPFGVYYTLLKIKELGKLPSSMQLSLSKNHPLIKEYAAIKIGNEILKPDMDLMAFSEKPDKPIIIFSLKTSLRERAGQSHRWKLILDIAQYCDFLKEKYNINYKPEKEIKFGFITTNFYKELLEPQYRATITFFDYVYIARKTEHILPHVKRLSEIINDLNKIF
ncbi:MAG: hypothetical protein KatS3mg097_618 [Candidatus Parcubacteria bacterium]|nr:MAG: hypothetical protein KatS3mg097_618 [Candidatus Parcubacteria bacterium]